jgi:hypothetical protein
MPMFRNFRDFDAELCRADATALHSIPFDSSAEGKGLQGFGDRGAVGARIGKRSGKHVAGKPGKRVYVTDIHGYFSLGERVPMYTRQGKSRKAIKTNAGGLRRFVKAPGLPQFRRNFQ